MINERRLFANASSKTFIYCFIMTQSHGHEVKKSRDTVIRNYQKIDGRKSGFGHLESITKNDFDN